MGLRESVEKILNIEELATIEECKDILSSTSVSDRVLRITKHLSVLLSSPDPVDQALDDANMRAVTAEVEQTKAESELTRVRLMIASWASQLESQATVRGDMPFEDVAKLAGKMRNFIE